MLLISLDLPAMGRFILLVKEKGDLYGHAQESAVPEEWKQFLKINADFFKGPTQ